MGHVEHTSNSPKTAEGIEEESVDNEVVRALFHGDTLAYREWARDFTTQRWNVGRNVQHNLFTFPAFFDPKSHATVLNALCNTVRLQGFARYKWQDEPEHIEKAVQYLLRSLNLHTSDSGVIRDSGGLSLLRDLSGTAKGRFPPYQSGDMNWHTDGYYNHPANQVRTFTLHCIEPAAEGGALRLLDDQLLIFTLIQHHPKEAALLAHPQAMCLPANQDKLGHNRPDRAVPVIANNGDGSLSMRFTTRTKNISWRCTNTKRAAETAADLIDQLQAFQSELTLQKGEGIISRNVLHARSAFLDNSGVSTRQILRGRFNSLPVANTHNGAAE